MQLNGKEFHGYLDTTTAESKGFQYGNLGMTLGTTGRYPIEPWKIWETYADAKEYVKYDGNDASAYVGMILTVTTGDDAGVYVVTAVGADAIDSNNNFIGLVKIGMESDILSIIESNESDILSIIESNESDILSIIESNEEVTAASLNDLNKRLLSGEITVETLTGTDKGADNFAAYQFKKGGEDLVKITIPGDTSLYSCEYISPDSSDKDAGKIHMKYLLYNGEIKDVYVDINETMVASEVNALIKSALTDKSTGYITDEIKDKDTKLVTSGAVYNAVSELKDEIDKLGDGLDDVWAGTVKLGDLLDGDSDDEEFFTTIDVGNLKAGTTIDERMSVRDLLVSILRKEIWATGKTAPSIKSFSLYGSVNGTNQIIASTSSTPTYEVGTTLIPSLRESDIVYDKGTIETYNSVNKTSTSSGCEFDYSKHTLSNSGTTVTLGQETKKFTLSVPYTQSTAVTTSNIGTKASGDNASHNIIIGASVASKSVSVKGEYRVYYGNITIGDNTASDSAIATYLKSNGSKTFTNGTSNVTLNGGSITTGSNQRFYVLCPSEMKLYGTQMNLNIKPHYTADYTYTLPNGTFKSYKIYGWTPVDQTYKDVKIVKA
jgi:hypothetical protein